MTKCKYAYDEADSTCKSCNGSTIKIDGTEYDAIECDAFEPDIPDDYEDETEEVMSDYDGFENIPDGVDEEIPFDEPNEDADEVKEEETSISSHKEEKSLESQNTSSEYVSKATVKSIAYSVGMTVKVGDEYHKFVAQEEWEMNDSCNVKKERENLWNHLVGQIEDMVEDVLDE